MTDMQPQLPASKQRQQTDNGQQYAEFKLPSINTQRVKQQPSVGMDNPNKQKYAPILRN